MTFSGSMASGWLSHWWNMSVQWNEHCPLPQVHQVIKLTQWIPVSSLLMLLSVLSLVWSRVQSLCVFLHLTWRTKERQLQREALHVTFHLFLHWLLRPHRGTSAPAHTERTPDNTCKHKHMGLWLKKNKDQDSPLGGLTNISLIFLPLKSAGIQPFLYSLHLGSLGKGISISKPTWDTQ